jgi:hypothetical protein
MSIPRWPGVDAPGGRRGGPSKCSGGPRGQRTAPATPSRAHTLRIALVAGAVAVSPLGPTIVVTEEVHGEGVTDGESFGTAFVG